MYITHILRLYLYALPALFIVQAILDSKVEASGRSLRPFTGPNLAQQISDQQRQPQEHQLQNKTNAHTGTVDDKAAALLSSISPAADTITKIENESVPVLETAQKPKENETWPSWPFWPRSFSPLSNRKAQNRSARIPLRPGDVIAEPVTVANPKVNLRMKAPDTEAGPRDAVAQSSETVMPQSGPMSERQSVPEVRPALAQNLPPLADEPVFVVRKTPGSHSSTLSAVPLQEFRAAANHTLVSETQNATFAHSTNDASESEKVNSPYSPKIAARIAEAIVNGTIALANSNVKEDNSTLATKSAEMLPVYGSTNLTANSLKRNMENLQQPLATQKSLLGRIGSQITLRNTAIAAGLAAGAYSAYKLAQPPVSYSHNTLTINRVRSTFVLLPSRKLRSSELYESIAALLEMLNTRKISLLDSMGEPIREELFAQMQGYGDRMWSGKMLQSFTHNSIERGVLSGKISTDDITNSVRTDLATVVDLDIELKRRQMRDDLSEDDHIREIFFENIGRGTKLEMRMLANQLKSCIKVHRNAAKSPQHKPQHSVKSFAPMRMTVGSDGQNVYVPASRVCKQTISLWYTGSKYRAMVSVEYLRDVARYTLPLLDFGSQASGDRVKAIEHNFYSEDPILAEKTIIPFQEVPRAFYDIGSQ